MENARSQCRRLQDGRVVYVAEVLVVIPTGSSITNRDISLIRRGRLNNSCVRSSMLHGSEELRQKQGTDDIILVLQQNTL